MHALDEHLTQDGYRKEQLTHFPLYVKESVVGHYVMQE